MPEYIEQNITHYPEIPIMFVLRSINSLNYDLRKVSSYLKCTGNVTPKMLANLQQEMQDLKVNNDYMIKKITQELNSYQS
jgi:hypothetical protein